MLARRAGLQTLASDVALHDIGFISADATERRDDLTGQSALKHSSISDVLPVDHTICIVKVCESHLSN